MTTDIRAMRVTVLGSGTSTGVPVPACGCTVCTSPDRRNRRLRSSVFVEVGPVGILIDSGPDFRYQSLRAGIRTIDAVFYTHSHADHILGLDDLRAFNFVRQGSIPIFGDNRTLADLRQIFYYVFSPDGSYEGGALPELVPTEVEPYRPVSIAGVEVLPLALRHGNYDILGYRIGDFAYLTDCCEIPERSHEQLSGLDVLILDGLRNREHPTHFTLKQAVRAAEAIQPRRTYLTHISHEVEYGEGNMWLRQLSSVPIELAYDGLSLRMKAPA